MPQDWEDPCRVPPHGGPPSGGNVSDVAHGRQVGLTTSVCVNDCSGFGGGGDVHLPPTE